MEMRRRDFLKYSAVGAAMAMGVGPMGMGTPSRAYGQSTMEQCVPRFSDKEYARRLKAVQDGMKKRNIDCLLFPTNESVIYLTNVNFLFFGCYLLVPREGEPTLFSDTVCYRSLEDRMNNGPIDGSRYWGGENSIHIEACSAIKDVRGVAGPKQPEAIAAWIKKQGCEKGKIGIVGRDIMWGALAGGGLVGNTGPNGVDPMFYRMLLAKVPDASFFDASEVLMEARRVKSAEEIESIRNGTKVADLCAEAIAKEMRKPGANERNLWAAYWDTLFRSGGGYHWWFMGWTTHTANPQDYGAHYYPYDYPLKEGDLFVCEIVPEWKDGYAGHIDVSFVLGEPVMAKEYEKMNKVCMDAYNAVVDCLKPGTLAKEILTKGDKPIAEAGYMRCAPLLYGLGIYGMEPPFVGLPPGPWDKPIPLEPGMTVNVISHVFDIKTNVCVRTGSMHLITETGSECLNNTSFPRGLVVV